MKRRRWLHRHCHTMESVEGELVDIYNAQARYFERLERVQSDNITMHAELIAALARVYQSVHSE